MIIKEEYNNAPIDVINTRYEIAHTIAEYKAQKYADYVIAQEKYNLYHRFSDLISMVDNGIACNMFTQEELKSIINEQDELTQRILLMQYGKHIIIN